MTSTTEHVRPPESSASSHEGESSIRYTPELDDDEQHYHDEAGEDGAIEMRRLVDGRELDDETRDGPESFMSRRTSVQSFELYTPDEERRVRKKLDVRLTLFVALLYMLSFLDRSNIGNAKVAGLMHDLQLDDNKFEWLLTVFYITYILFEWMTVLYQIFPPHIYISVCVCAWGVLASSQALTTSFGGMLFLRMLLGVGEAAFVGIPFYLTFFYKREELALRTGLFISAAPLATTFASSLAYAIMDFGFAQRVQIASWRLLFLLEGFPAVVVAVWCWSWLPDSPAHAWWLTARERKVAVVRMRKEKSLVTSSKHEKDATSHFSFKEVARTLRDPKAYITAMIFFCCNVAFSSMPVFLPTIVKSMGYSSRASQALSAPPFLFAFLTVILTALISDRTRERSILLLFHLLMAMLGYLCLTIIGFLDGGLTTLRYIAIYPICAGFFSAITLIITWTVNNQSSNEGKGTGMAILNIIGQCGPLIGTRLYPDSAAPYFTAGMTVCTISMGIAALLTFVLRIMLVRENRKLASWRGSSEREKFMYIL